MGRAKHTWTFTTEGFKTFVAPEGVEVVWDDNIAGFGLRTRGRQDADSWRWIYSYRHGVSRKHVTLTLGSPLKYAPQEARKWAEKAYKESNGTADPFSVKQARRAAETAERARPTVTRLWEEWLAAEGHTKKAKSAALDAQLWTQHIKPRLGAMKVADVKPRDVNSLKEALKDRPVAANRCIALLSVMFTFAVTHEYRAGCAPEHPIKGGAVKRNKETPVDFYFTPEQLGRLLEAADEDDNTAAGLAIRTLALTGARLSEVTTAHWGQLTEREDGRLLWTVERTNTKTGEVYQRVLDLDLSRRLREWRPLSVALQKVVEMDTPLRVFPGTQEQGSEIQLWCPWRRIKKAAAVKEGRMHDLRHTVATAIVKETGSLEAAKRQLGHKHIVTTQRYAHFVIEQAEQTSDLLAQHAADAVAKARAKKERSEVVELRLEGAA